MAELCRDLAREHPEGPLFRNTRGKPWTRNAIRIRFRNLRKRLGLAPGVVAYAFRHTYITDALEKGVPIASLAELAGHKDTRMISTVYSKLSQKRQHLAEMAAKAAAESVPSQPHRTVVDAWGRDAHCFIKVGGKLLLGDADGSPLDPVPRRLKLTGRDQRIHRRREPLPADGLPGARSLTNSSVLSGVLSKYPERGGEPSFSRRERKTSRPCRHRRHTAKRRRDTMRNITGKTLKAFEKSATTTGPTAILR